MYCNMYEHVNNMKNKSMTWALKSISWDHVQKKIIENPSI